MKDEKKKRKLKEERKIKQNTSKRRNCDICRECNVKMTKSEKINYVCMNEWKKERTNETKNNKNNE